MRICKQWSLVGIPYLYLNSRLHWFWLLKKKKNTYNENPYYIYKLYVFIFMIRCIRSPPCQIETKDIQRWCSRGHVIMIKVLFDTFHGNEIRCMHCCFNRNREGTPEQSPYNVTDNLNFRYSHRCPFIHDLYSTTTIAFFEKHELNIFKKNSITIIQMMICVLISL